MRINKIVKSILVLCLLSAIAISFVGCNKEGPTEWEKEAEGKLDNQYKNDRYYFQQGYRNDWTANFKEDEHALESKYLLLYEMWPTEAEGNAEYSIYTGDTNSMRTTVLDTVEKMQKPDMNLYFNSRFIKDETPREGFEFKSQNELVIYNKLQYQRVKYSFTKDGADWVGEFFVTMKGSKYYVITWERKADVADTYQQQFLESIKDYRFRGLEDE